jgi:hypothetical protein
MSDVLYYTICGLIKCFIFCTIYEHTNQNQIFIMCVRTVNLNDVAQIRNLNRFFSDTIFNYHHIIVLLFSFIIHNLIGVNCM